MQNEMVFGEMKIACIWFAQPTGYSGKEKSLFHLSQVSRVGNPKSLSDEFSVNSWRRTLSMCCDWLPRSDLSRYQQLLII